MAPMTARFGVLAGLLLAAVAVAGCGSSAPSSDVSILTPAPGTLVCFRAETTHEVLPVTHGERFTIVSWYL